MEWSLIWVPVFALGCLVLFASFCLVGIRRWKQGKRMYLESDSQSVPAEDFQGQRRGLSGLLGEARIRIPVQTGYGTSGSSGTAEWASSIEAVVSPSSQYQPPFKSHESMLDGFVTSPFLASASGLYCLPSHQHESNSNHGWIGNSVLLSGTDVSSSAVYPNLSYTVRLMDVDLAELGSGASGCVREAIYVDPHGKVFHVAAKYARDASFNTSKLLRSELEIISKLPLHANVLNYFGGNITGIDYNEHDGVDSCFIVMELMFTNLQSVIHGNMFAKGMGYSLMLRISLDIVNGLDHLHEYGIIHYDLKPSNILLDEDFGAKLADFGSSKKTLRSRTSASFRGTMGYIAPEVLLSHFMDRLKVSDKLDIYSMGVVMWEMVTGECPPSPLSSCSSSIQESLTSSKEIVPYIVSYKSFKYASEERCPSALKTLIEDCLNIEPSLRPTTKDVKDRLLIMQSQHLI